MWLASALLYSNLWAADTTLSIIESAQALALKKNRQFAALALTKAIEEPSHGTSVKNRTRLLETLNKISKVFFTDKGQKLFESAQSTMFENPDVALGHYREALNLEDNNILILTNMATILLAKQDCAGANAVLTKARAVNAYAPEPAVLELRSLICEKNFTGFREKIKQLPPLEKRQEAFVQFLTAQDLVEQKMWRRANDLLLKLSEDEPHFPETYYWLIKTGSELNRETDSWAEKFVSLCKGVTVRTRKQFVLEPRLCAHVKEVQGDMAKKSSDI